MQIGFLHVVGTAVLVAMLMGSAFVVGKRTQHVDSTSAVALTAVAATSAPPLETEAPEETDYPVVRIIDGDTIVILFEGKNEPVRLIGVDAPEMHDARGGVQCFAVEAKKRMEKSLAGKRVRVVFDASQGERDAFKRLLAYVYVGDVFVNRLIVAEGYAHEYTYRDPYEERTTLIAAEKEARAGKRGLWAPGVCAVAAVEAPAVAVPHTNVPVPMLPVPSVPEPVGMPAVEMPHRELPPVPMQTPLPENLPAPPPPESGTTSVVCSANTYNCTDFKSQKEAQAVYDQCGGVSNDVHKLDRNKDGQACDSLR